MGRRWVGVGTGGVRVAAWGVLRRGGGERRAGGRGWEAERAGVRSSWEVELMSASFSLSDCGEVVGGQAAGSRTSEGMNE